MINKTSLQLRAIGSTLIDAGELIEAVTVERYRMTIIGGWVRTTGHMIEGGVYEAATPVIMMQIEELEKMPSPFFSALIAGHFRSIAVALAQGASNVEMIDRFLGELYDDLINGLPDVVAAWNAGVKA